MSLLFGKILRLDVNADTYPYYRIPSDNPFIGVNGARPEIWAYGFRNPWGLDFITDGRGSTLLIISGAGYKSGSGQEEINVVAGISKRAQI